MPKTLKIFFLLVFMLVCQSNLSAETLSAGISFTWDKITQEERDNNIVEVRQKVITDDILLNFDKDVFEEKYANFKKDNTYKENVIAAKLGFTDQEDKILVPFYVKKYLYGYGVIYKNDLTHCYYYNALGRLFVVEKFDKNYNEYPVVSYQYDKKGKLKAAVYAQDEYDEYVYNPKGIFLGRWYKEHYYNSRGNIVITRILPE